MTTDALGWELCDPHYVPPMWTPPVRRPWQAGYAEEASRREEAMFKSRWAPRENFGCVFARGQLWVLGGRGDGDELLDDVWGEVERSDTEFNTAFSAKSPNFRGLVLFCIGADFYTEIRIFQHFFSRTTRFAFICTAPISKFEQTCVKLFLTFVQIWKKKKSLFEILKYFSTVFIEISTDFDQNFTEFSLNILKNDERSTKLLNF